jgi:hypothetical protein
MGVDAETARLLLNGIAPTVRMRAEDADNLGIGDAINGYSNLTYAFRSGDG